MSCLFSTFHAHICIVTYFSAVSRPNFVASLTHSSTVHKFQTPYYESSWRREMKLKCTQNLALSFPKTLKSHRPASCNSANTSLRNKCLFHTPPPLPLPHRRPWCCLRLVAPTAHPKSILNTHDFTFRYNYGYQRRALQLHCTCQGDVTRAEMKKCKYR